MFVSDSTGIGPFTVAAARRESNAFCRRVVSGALGGGKWIVARWVGGVCLRGFQSACETTETMHYI